MNTNFGVSADLSGALAVVGAAAPDASIGDTPSNGAAYVFERQIDGDETWIEISRRTAPISFDADEFGASVALEGDILVVGDPANGYAYVLSATDPAQPAVVLTAPTSSSFMDEFGRSVDVSVDRIIVGAPGIDSSYIFVRQIDSWILEQPLGRFDFDSDFPSGRFGESVAISAGFAVVGAPGLSAESGVVHVFSLGESGWAPEDVLIPDASVPDDRFGWRVGILGDVLVAGAPGAASAHVFRRDVSFWFEEQGLFASEGFGTSVALGNDTLVVGDPSTTSAIMFVRSSEAGWEEHDRLLPEGGSSYESFGESAALDGPRTLIGAPTYAGVDTILGAAYLYHPLPAPPGTAPTLVEPSDGEQGVSPDPIFQWQAVSGAASYYLQVASSSAFFEEEIVAEADGIAALSYQVTGLSRGETYYWRVLGANEGGEGPWSEPVSFTTIVAPPSEPPELVSPADGTAGTAPDTTLQWEAVDGAAIYRLQVATSSAFQLEEIVVDADSLTALSYQVTGLAPGQTYYWRVLGANEGGPGPWSEVFSFTIVVEPPPTSPALRIPGQGATAVLSDALFAWNAVEGAETYRLEVAAGTPFDESNLVVDEEGIADTSYQARGLVPGQAYAWRVTAVNPGGESEPSAARSFVTYGSSVAVAIERAFGDVTRSSSHRLVALPGRVSLSPSSTLEGSAPDDWRLFWDNGDPGGRDVHLEEYDGSSRFNFTPGRGFWLLSRQPWRVDQTFETIPLAPDGTYTIPLHPGWNIISNPFDTGVAWMDVLVRNDLSSALMTYTGAYGMTETFESAREGMAYYFLNPPDRALERLVIPYPDALGVIEKRELSSRERGRIQLGLYLKGVLAASAEAGWSADASQVLDRHDQFAPPSDFETASLRLVREDLSEFYQELMAEYRAPSPDGYVFDLAVRAPRGEAVELRTEEFYGFDGMEAHLVDTRTSRFIPLRKADVVKAIEMDDPRRYRLVIGTPEYVGRKKDELVPSVFALLNNYPNPFSGATVIEYAVPAEGEGADLRMEIFDLLGRRVRVVVSGPQDAGLHRVVFDSRDDAGMELAGGVYFCRMRAGEFVQTVKMVLIR